MDKNQPAKERRESLEQAARRLLAKMDARKRPAGERPAEIQKLDRQAPSVGGKVGEVAAVSAFLTGQARPGTGKAVVIIVAANDDRAGMPRGDGYGRADLIVFPGLGGISAVATRPYSDDSADQIARISALLRLHAPSEWKW